MLSTLLQTKPSWASWRHHNPAMPVGSEWRTCVINNSCLYAASLQEGYWGLLLTFVVLWEKCKQFSTHLNTLCLRKLAGTQNLIMQYWKQCLPRKSEIKILTLASCFCKGHLVVNWALVMQVMKCTHYREASETGTALQQSSSSPCFSASEGVEQKSAPQAAVKRMLTIFPNQQYLLTALACIHMNFSQLFSKIIHSITWKFVLQQKPKYCLQSLEGLQAKRKEPGICF